MWVGYLFGIIFILYTGIIIVFIIRDRIKSRRRIDFAAIFKKLFLIVAITAFVVGAAYLTPIIWLREAVVYMWNKIIFPFLGYIVIILVGASFQMLGNKIKKFYYRRIKKYDYHDEID